MDQSNKEKKKQKTKCTKPGPKLENKLSIAQSQKKKI